MGVVGEEAADGEEATPRDRTLCTVFVFFTGGQERRCQEECTGMRHAADDPHRIRAHGTTSSKTQGLYHSSRFLNIPTIFQMACISVCTYGQRRDASACFLIKNIGSNDNSQTVSLTVFRILVSLQRPS